MRLGATITSERGKAVTKTGNEQITIKINGENREKLGTLDVIYRDGLLTIEWIGEHAPKYLMLFEDEL